MHRYIAGGDRDRRFAAGGGAVHNDRSFQTQNLVIGGDPALVGL